MIISFFGHSDFVDTKNTFKNKILEIIKEKIKKQEKIYFYLGNYGNFDKFAKQICLNIKSTHKNVKICFISPYQNENYLKKHRQYYDEIILPDIRNVPPKYAIKERNFWIVQNSDFIISYINYQFGNSIKYIRYAKKLKKSYINLGTYKI